VTNAPKWLNTIVLNRPDTGATRFVP